MDKKTMLEKEDTIIRISDKRKLLEISDLDTEKIAEMNDEQLNAYAEALHMFLQRFPTMQERLQVSIEAKEYTSTLQWLTSIGNALTRINADGLAKNCQKQIAANQNIDNIRHEKLAAFVSFFISSVALLFDDIKKLIEKIEPEQENSNETEGAIDIDDIKNKLFNLSEVNIDKIKALSDEDIPGFIEALSAFAGDVSKHAKRIKSSLKAKDNAAVLQKIKNIEESLANIHADDLLEECQSQVELLGNVNNIRHEKLEALVDYLFSSLSMFASEIKGNFPKNLIEMSTFLPFNTDPSKKTILVIDDSAMFVQNLKRTIETNIIQVMGVNSKESALLYVKVSKPDLFILNDDMPGMDGCEFAKKIRSMKQSAPIIFLTSNATKEYMLKAMSAGVADFIIKPVSATDVQEKVDKHLRG